jgi:UDP-GlcNAc:undecaprenyl-phosphate GlcNAc-1-phosphate transferase
MGDVGSAFLGFVFACLAIIAARYDQAQTSFLVMPLLLFNYIYDTVFTFFRRLIRGENVLMGHKEHLYQVFNQIGYSHRTVSLFHYAVSIVQGLGAWWMVNSQYEIRIVAFVPFLLFQIIYTMAIFHMKKKKDLLVQNA